MKKKHTQDTKKRRIHAEGGKRYEENEGNIINSHVTQVIEARAFL